MSFQAVTWVLAYSESRLGDRLVMLSIANHADHTTGEAWPSVETIAAEARMSDRQVQRALKRLEAAGEIEIKRSRGPRGTHRYRLIGVTNCHPDKLSGGVTNRVKNMPEMSPEQSGTVSKKEDPPKPPEGLDGVAWERYAEYRQAIRKPIKPVSMPAAQRKLAGFGADQAAVVEQSIANGWQGLFAVKEGGNGAGRQSRKPSAVERAQRATGGGF